MSEEEIIKNLNELISWKGKNIEIRDYEIEAIQGLLDLYKAEKEKYKELEQDYIVLDQEFRNEKEKNIELMEEYHKRVQEKLVNN